jgi:CRP/FNR family cyclic AMP-dependent transcriptional regulator
LRFDVACERRLARQGNGDISGDDLRDLATLCMDPAIPPALIDPAWPDSLRALVARGELRRYRKNTVMIQEGDVGDTLFIVLLGEVKAYSCDSRDREIVYGVYGPGEYLGEMSLDGGPRSASVITLEAVTCAVITRKTLRAHIAEEPEFAFELLNRVIRRARIATDNARSLALLDVYGRLARILNQLATETEGEIRAIPQRITHQELANRVGSSREMVSKLLKDLERGGYVESRAGRLRLLKPLPSGW